MRLTARDSPLPTIDYLRTAGGIFHDCMMPDVDLLTWMLGEYPIRVSVHASAMIPEIKAIDDFDTVAGVFHFPSGTVGMVDLSRNSCYGYDQRVEVFGPKGLIDATNEQPIHCVTAQLGQRKPPIWYKFASRFRNAYTREMEYFLDVALGKAQPLVQEIMTVSKIADACEKSARTGQSQELESAPLLSLAVIGATSLPRSSGGRHYRRRRRAPSAPSYISRRAGPLWRFARELLRRAHLLDLPEKCGTLT
ncbi:unnamed protein product [Trichogramma brassicae]|uniref:GFO/IDH/MocA-like oxidoreductase domain-containing protein n=1 Tax=Trichogramma brassicae TaxID=86971 RepID=A0A6H5ITF8_9HYME|nr:unnamed protein product [Trichogramma brassicae]